MCIRRLISDGLELELFIVGEGFLKDSIINIIETNELQDSVILTGFLDNPYPLLASADIYVCSSIAEGLNTAISEALVLGRPVISTECSGTSELLGDSQFGLVVLNDENSLYKGLRELLSEPVLRQRLSDAAFTRGLEFSITKPMETIYRLIA